MTGTRISRRTLLKRTALTMAAALPVFAGRAWPAAGSPAPLTPEEILEALAPCPDAERVWSVTGRECPALASFDRIIRDFMTARHVSSASLAVTRRSRLVYARGYNWDRPAASTIQPATPFRIASLSKPLTSAGVLWLAQQGKLRLTDKLLDLVPMAPLAGEKNDPRLAQVTLLHILRHQAGWDRDRSFDPMFRDSLIAAGQGVPLPIGTRHIIRYMAGKPLDWDPGTHYAYSNFGYCLLGRVIEAASGQDYGRFMRETIFRKLGIDGIRLGATAFAGRLAEEPLYHTQDHTLYPSVVTAGAPRIAPESYGAWNLENMDAHGGWLASAADLARFATAFDPTGGFPLLSAERVEETFAIPPTGLDSGGAYYGCGWQVRPVGASRNTWHTGSLPGTFTIMVRRNDGLNWVLLLNQRDDPSGLDYGAIDGLLHQAANAVKTWPDYDLFLTGVPRSAGLDTA